MSQIEDGGLFNFLGVTNFLEGDFFGWYLAVWNKDVAGAIRKLASGISEFEPATGTIRPEETRDLLKRLYQYLIPRELRHDLGEYYTPDWLAQLVLDDLGYDGNPAKRLLDPACGSGTFLVLAIRRVKEYADEHLELDPRDVIRQVLENVVGFDLNPLAVIAARTNFLLALGNWIRHVGAVQIPVYLCDSILTPAAENATPRTLEHAADVGVPTTVCTFWVPRVFVESRQIAQLMSLLESSLSSRYSTAEFVERVRESLPRLVDEQSVRTIEELYDTVLRLEREGRNGIWARILKNAFAPMFQGSFDYVAGNPPWVNWESLADTYREATRKLWQHYGLFSLTGHAARLGGGKKDIAMLMLYVSADHYLKPNGKLGFVVTQTLLKTKGAGDGFRRFRLGDGARLKVEKVNDLVALQPFEGASNRTATILLGKGSATEYPVPYQMWRKSRRGRIPPDVQLADIDEHVERYDFVAEPVDTSQVTSPWLTARPGTIAALRKLIGPSFYQAHAGACTWLNGVYWIKILDRRPDGLLQAANLYDVGTTTLPEVKMLLEPDLVYPLLRGRDVDRWSAQPSVYIILTQDPETRTGHDERWMKQHLRRTYAYLKGFEQSLRQRSGYKSYFRADRDPFYSIYNVGSHTLAPYKVVWQEQSSELTAAVTESVDGVMVVPDHKLMMVACSSSDEAHFLCAALNSAPARLVVKSYGVETSTSTHVLENIAVPQFVPSNPLHLNLAKSSRQAHDLRRVEADPAALSGLQESLDRLAARMWGVTLAELSGMQDSLRILT